jgi:hypothetical protein
MNVFGFLAFFFIMTGLLFKLMHWPGANVSLVLGVMLLNVGFLPMFFYDRYKRSLA